jgi:predicted nucleic acid-binding protein
LSLFVDTSAFYAAADSSDSHHAQAARIITAGEPLVTTDQVLVECCLLIARRSGQRAADQFWGSLRDGRARIELVLRGDLDNAWRIGEEFADQDFSLVDRTSFAVMERLGISRVASFDDHFAVYRFGPRRSRSFDVVR